MLRRELCVFSQNASRCVGWHSQTRNITWGLRAGHLQAAICCDSHMAKLCPEVSHLTAKCRITVTRGRFILCSFISEENQNISIFLGMPWATEPSSHVIINLPGDKGLSGASPAAPLHFPAPTSPPANTNGCSMGNLPARHHEHLQLSKGIRGPSC